MLDNSTQILGSIIMFAGNFAPQGWSLCQGQIIAISSNTPLFSILGTTYGGDGRTTFGLPDLRGRTPIGTGSGPNLSSYRLGQTGGVESVVLTKDQLPPHSHTATLNNATVEGTIKVSSNEADEDDAEDNFIGTPSENLFTGTAADTALGAGSFQGSVNASSVTVDDTGNKQAHNNLQPFCGINFIISLSGQYPSRS